MGLRRGRDHRAARRGGSAIALDRRDRIRVRDVFSGVLGTYRRHFWRVTLSALIVFGLLESLDVVVDFHEGGTRAVALAGTGLFVLLIDTFGAVFYPGLLDRLVGEESHGDEHQSILTVMATLPYWRLIRAEALLVVFVLLAVLLFVVPAVLVFTLFCLIGPMITIEDQSVIGAFRRSFQLVRRHFWIVLFLVTVPTLVEDLVLALVEHRVHSEAFVWQFLAGGLVGVVIGSFVGLILVHLAYRLIDAHPIDA